MNNNTNYQKYSNLLKKLSITEIGKIKFDDTNGYFISSGLKENKEILIKVSPDNDLEKWIQYKKELKADKVINQINSNKKGGKQIKKPSVINIGKNESIQWLLREYIEGETLSEYDFNKPIKGYDVLKEDFVKKEYLIDQIANFINTCKNNSSGTISKFSSVNRYESNLDKLNLDNVCNEINFDLFYSRKIYNKNLATYLNKSNLCVSFGDFIPSNILINNSEEVFISDFEWLSIDNNTTDGAMLWLFLHRYPKWQKRLIAKLIKNRNDQLLFNMSVIRIILNWYYGLYVLMYDDKSKMNLLNKKYFRKHQWLEYLKRIQRNV